MGCVTWKMAWVGLNWLGDLEDCLWVGLNGLGDLEDSFSFN